MTDWNAQQYLKFEDQRTRPAIDLLARIPLQNARTCIDLGCGPGNSTELLAHRFPESKIIGIDTSENMLTEARKRLPAVTFKQAEIATWEPEKPCDVIYANAALQWVPNHPTLLPRLASFLAVGGCLAVQMPDNLDEPSHALMRETASNGPWAESLMSAFTAREIIGSFENYYRYLLEAGCSVDLWKTVYVHPLDGAEAIVEWLISTGLKPFVEPLSRDEKDAFLEAYLERIKVTYPEQKDGKVLLQFPRLFMIARRT